MATSVSKKAIEMWRKKAMSAANRTKKLKEKGEEITNTAVRSIEVGGAAFAFGLADGKFGGVEIMGMPLDLVGAITAHGAGFLGLGGDASSHLHAIGDGALASYLVTTGRKVGAEWKAKELAGASASGELTPEEIAEYAR